MVGARGAAVDGDEGAVMEGLGCDGGGTGTRVRVVVWVLVWVLVLEPELVGIMFVFVVVWARELGDVGMAVVSDFCMFLLVQCSACFSV